MKQDIQSRQDVEILVQTFYGKVRQHEVIGPFFNGMITDWDEHIHKLSDFWETNLFFVKAYKGNPLRAHLDVDSHFDHTIAQAHFGHWLELWFSTLDELFEGKNATLAKERARNMAHIMLSLIHILSGFTLYNPRRDIDIDKAKADKYVAKAQELLVKAENKNPNNPRVHLQKGITSAYTGQFEQGIEQLEYALKLYEQYPAPHKIYPNWGKGWISVWLPRAQKMAAQSKKP